MVKVIVKYDYDATQDDELTIKNGDIITDVKKQPGGWWEGVLNGQRGVFPDNFVEDYTPPPMAEPPKGPKPGAGKNVSDIKSRIADQIKAGPPPPMKAGGGKPKQMAIVLFEYKPEQPDELELNEGDEVEIVRMAEQGWWEGVLRGRTGMFPSNFVKLLEVPAPAPTAMAPSVAAGYAPGPPKHNDMPMKTNTGGRPPVVEKKVLPPPAVESANPPLLPKRNRGTKAKVLFSYKACNEDELTLEEGQIIQVTDMKLDDAGWWKGELAGRVGVFPDNFVQLLTDEEPAPPTATGRLNKAPLQPPPEADQPQPGRLPPRPGGLAKPVEMTTTDSGRGLSINSKPKAADIEPARPLVNGRVDEKTAMSLMEEIEKLKSSMVTKESHELLQRELKATKEAFENYKKENNKKLLELMKEIDEERKLGVQSNVEIARIRKLAEEQWVGK